MKRKKKTSSYFLNDLVSTFTLHKFMKSITTPFEKMKLYKDGIIDKQGEILEDDKITPYDRMIIGIKKLLMQIPNPNTKARLKNLTTAIQFFAESSGEIGADPELVYTEIMNFLEEEMSAGGMPGMAVGNEQIAGLGNDIAGLPISPRVQRNCTRKNTRKYRNINIKDQ